MDRPPESIDGARVVRWTRIDGRHRFTGACAHIVGGSTQGPAAGLAICQYEAESAYYLFGCYEEWNSVTDTYHDTLQDAMGQAEFEYEGVTETWMAA